MKYSSSAAVVGAAVALAAGASADGSFHEEFTVASWEENWSYSNAEKYTGKFAVETMVTGTDDTGLKVGSITYPTATHSITAIIAHFRSSTCAPELVGDGKGAALRCGDASSYADRSVQGQDCSAVRAQS